MRFNPNEDHNLFERFTLDNIYNYTSYIDILNVIDARNYDTLPSLVDHALNELVLRVEAQPRLEGDLIASRNSGEPIGIYNRKKLEYTDDIYYDVPHSTLYDYRTVTGQQKYDTLQNSVFALDGANNRILMTYELAQTECVLIDGLYYLKYTMQYVHSDIWTELQARTFTPFQLTRSSGKLPRQIISKIFAYADLTEANCGGTGSTRSYQWFDTDHDEIGYCEHYEEYYQRDMLIYHEDNRCYYHEDVYDEYTESNDNRDSRTYQLNGYHCGLPCEHIRPNQETLRTDVPALQQFTIGFEIEKRHILSVEGYEITRGDSVENQPLFNHWELDSSCGVEGITHVYNLADYETFEEHVDDSDYVDAPHHISCGGHTNIAYQPTSITDFQLSLQTIQPFVGVLYSMYKKRLRNSYTYNNKKLNQRNQGYSPITIKGSPERAEFRIPSGIKHKAQLLRRFKLFAHLVTHIHTYETNKKYYMERMETSHSRNKVKYGINKLYKDFAYDVCFNHNFYNSILYKRTQFLLSDIGYILEQSYQGRIEQLKTMLINAYQFQAWLDDSSDVNLTSIKQYIQLRNNDSSNPLTPAQRHWQPTFTPEECRNDFIDNPDAAIQDDHSLTTENVSL